MLNRWCGWLAVTGLLCACSSAPLRTIDDREREAADLALEELMFAAEEDDDFLADDVIDEWEDEPWTQWRNREDPDLGAYGASDEDDEEL